MFALYHMQFLVLGLIFVPVLTSKKPCYDEDQLEKTAKRKLGDQYPQPTEAAAVSEPDTPRTCPVNLYEEQGISNRSISPWRYIWDTKEGRFPRTLAVAQCLCDGCIMSKEEDGKKHQHRGYNSVLVKQSRLVLKKELCADGKRYRLVPVNERVAVGCTCVKARRSRGHGSPPLPTLVFAYACLSMLLCVLKVG